MASTPIGDELAHALPVGTRLGEYEITGIVGTGGFSVVYAATDNLGRRLAIKEYMPESLARRLDGVTVAPRSERTEATFRQGLDSFVKEAKTLARFRNPAILGVYAFWEAHGTAYMAMPLITGRTLKEELRARAEPPDEAWLRHLASRLLDVLEVLHAERVWHRDIAPDNIVLQDGEPVLLDFGAARRVIGESTQTLTAILKPGYAPWEQYGEAPGLQQGPWTDLYALAAVLYRAVSGKVPVASVSRAATDTMASAASLGRGRYSAGFLAAIDRALAVRPADRPQSVAEFRRLLDAAGSDDAEATRLLPSAPRAAPPAPPAVAPGSRRRLGGLLAGLLLLAGAGLAGWWWSAPPAGPARPGADAASAPHAEATLATPAPAASAPGPALPPAPTAAAPPAPASAAVVATSPAVAPPAAPAPAAPRTATPRERTAARTAGPETAGRPGSDPRCRDLLAQLSLGQGGAGLQAQLAQYHCQ